MTNHSMILRHKYVDRVCHWIVALSFLLLAFSGLGLFFPSLHWLTGILGTPQLARILHPWIGVAMVLGMTWLFLRYAAHNFFVATDWAWFRRIRDVLKGEVPDEVGKYNPGQKGLFWAIVATLLLLLISGLIVWRPYLAAMFPIPLIRLGLLAHAVMAVLFICLIIGHAYMAFWVKGSITGMIEGKVSRRWARHHHPRWYRDIVEKEKHG